MRSESLPYYRQLFERRSTPIVDHLYYQTRFDGFATRLLHLAKTEYEYMYFKTGILLRTVTLLSLVASRFSSVNSIPRCRFAVIHLDLKNTLLYLKLDDHERDQQHQCFNCSL